MLELIKGIFGSSLLDNVVTRIFVAGICCIARSMAEKLTKAMCQSVIEKLCTRLTPS